MLGDQPADKSVQRPIRQSDNLTHGGTFSVGSVPTGIAKPSEYNTTEQFTDGYGEGEVGTKGTFGGDFFSSLGQAKKKRSPPPEKKKASNPDVPRMSTKEINTAIYSADGSRLPESVEAIRNTPSSNSNTADGSRPPIPGSSGSNWRMMKVRRVYETAEEEGRDIDDVGLERFGTVEAWEAAKEEKRYMDNRGVGGRRHQQLQGRAGLPLSRSGTGTPEAGASADSDLDEFGRERRRPETPTSSSSIGPPTAGGVAGRYVFTEPASGPSSRPPSRAGSFRRPGSAAEEAANSRPSTPAPPGSTRERMEQRGTGGSKPSTPIPSVFTPPPLSAGMRKPSQLQTSTMASSSMADGVDQAQAPGNLSERPMSPTSLNRIQAKILRMRLMGGNAADLKDLEETYERESLRARQGDSGEGYFDGQEMGKEGRNGGAKTEIRVLPTLDGQGRLYDVGQQATRTQEQIEDEEAARLGPGNKRKRKEKYFETRDTATGEVIRYNADDDTTTLEEMVRQERFRGGAGDQKNMDMEMASRIAGDAKFEDDLDYMDDTADRLARKKIKTEQQKKLFAVNDFARTRQALENCQFCYQDTDTKTVPPQAAMVALGTRTYLSLPLNEPLVPGHATIVPIQHHLSSLEADDDTWDEIKVSLMKIRSKGILLIVCSGMQNFMKTLMQMHAESDKGVIFFETVMSLKGQRHTYIEAVPVPWATFEELPAYFREGILTSEAEWSQHKKLIDFASRPGGFRRSMVPNLPYFMVHWDYKGEKGFGHVIEGGEVATNSNTADSNEFDYDEGAKGGGEFSRFFAQEIIGNVLEVEPRLYRKPRRMDRRLNEERVKAFRKTYDKYDWTKMLAQTSDA